MPMVTSGQNENQVEKLTVKLDYRFPTVFILFCTSLKGNTA